MHGSQLDLQEDDRRIPESSLKSAKLVPTRYDEERIIPDVISESSFYENETASNLLNDRVDKIWNGGHLSGWDVPNWCVFDFKQPVRITEIAFRNCGDVTHDAKLINLDTSDNPSGPWRTISTFQTKEGITAWQLFSCSGVSRYWRLDVIERYTRYQVYLSGIRFKTSTEMGRFEHLSSVEKEFLRRSKRRDLYPNERVGVIEVENVAELGQLTALNFIEWIIENPTGVIGLPTGKTPELFIKWLRYYRENWNKDEVQKELLTFGIGLENKDDLKAFPTTSELRFIQLDEFFPISPAQHNSFLGYIRKYYLSTLQIKEENCLLMDFTKLPIFQKNDMHKVFPNDKVDITLKDRKAKNSLEALQKQALAEVDEFCKNYEQQVKKMGGYGFFLGGIGHDGHIAFNFRGCDPKLGTRLVVLNYETSAQSAGDFGGITNTRNKAAVTVGLNTIVHNKKAKIVIMAAGEKKAKRVKEAIMLPMHRLRPSSVLHDLPGARFYLTSGASIYLTDRRTEDIALACEKKTISEKIIFHTICKLAINLKKRVVELTAQDFLADSQAFPIYCYWTKQSKPISELTGNVEKFLIRLIERGVSLPANVRILHTSPHHDDIMLAYHEIMNFLFKYDTNYFTYVTSGFNSCPDKYIIRVLRRLNLKSDEDVKYYLESLLEDGYENEAEETEYKSEEKQDEEEPANSNSSSTIPVESMQNGGKPEPVPEESMIISNAEEAPIHWSQKTKKMSLERILDIFKRGYNLQRDSLVDEAETLLVLRRMKQVYGITKVDRFKSIIKYHLNEYFPSKLVGQQDNEKVKFFKGLVRESEVDRMWALNGINPKTNVFHLRSKFYTGEYFQPLPDQKKDAQPMFDLYQQLQPDLVTVAFDPEGTGPDTHYKVLQIVAQALRMAKTEKANLKPKIWGYRNVWHRFQICDSSIAIPVSAKSMTEMHKVFLASFGCQKQAEFPSPEYDGPFSVLSQRFHIQQQKELKILLGAEYFDTHWNKKIKNADGFILLKEMEVDQFLEHADDLRSKIEIHKQL
eukprot:CAMPEP_0201593132 /NCGR_PEP_ID=MMETSP0190_2-20130828/190838_1 /ASSEMBLY_ACC=CAM_ASM_000263 /TAXON_ID=37353 /ORGANISM="Rosalina sp." /LENGTH=1028 /DNA_ID=CAMNT_0048052225 /DNA_START=108 /DNA_END=3194 /DNA_ORIENTATION=-